MANDPSKDTSGEISDEPVANPTDSGRQNEPRPHSTQSPKKSTLSWTHSLRFRLTAWYTLVLALLLGIGGIALYWAAGRIVLRETDAYLSLEAHRIVSASTEETGDKPLGELREALGSVEGITLRSQALPGFVVFEPIYGRIVEPSTNRTVAMSPNLARKPDILSTMDDAMRGDAKYRSHNVFAGQDEEHSVRLRIEPIMLGSRLYILQLAVPWDDNEDAIERFGLFLSLCIPLIVVVSALGSWAVVGRTLRPIGRIVADVEAADIRSLSGALLPAPAETDSEVGRLVATLNGMAARMHRSFDAQRRFAADASHELRTPLTFMRGEIEYTLLRPRDAETYKHALENAVSAIDELSRIVESLSYLARLDSGESPSAHQPPTPVDIPAVLRVLVDEYMPTAQRKSIALSTRFAPAYVRGDDEQLRLMFRNLIDNALKYTPEGGAVDVTVAVDNDDVLIGVSDTGVGIADDDISRVFERFWRADKSRAVEPTGTGLGLSIAVQLAEAHGGSITVRSTIDVGTAFTVRLPAIKK